MLIALLLAAPDGNGGDMAVLMTKYGLPGLLVFGAGVLLPLAWTYMKALGALGKVILTAVWVVVLGTAVVWITIQAKQDLRRKYVVDGLATGIEEPDHLVFDDPHVYVRRLKDDSGRVRYEWALITGYPLQSRPLIIAVVGPDSLRKASFEATSAEDTLEWQYDAGSGAMRQISPGPPQILKRTSLRAAADPPVGVLVTVDIPQGRGR